MVTKTGSSKGLAIFFLVLALITLAIGVWMRFFKYAGYIKTNGIVVSVRQEEYWDSAEGRTYHYYYPTVKYTSDGKKYMGEVDLDHNSPIGSEIEILYNPNNFSRVTLYNSPHAIACFAVSTIMFVLSIVMFVKSHKTGDGSLS